MRGLIQGGTREYKRLQWLLVEEGYYMYWWLQGYWELQVGFIYFGIILFYFAILFTKRFIFLIFLFYWKWLLKIDKILISQLWHTGW